MRLLIFTVAALFFCTAAEAHVRIAPVESKAGATETYTARVPTEGKVATTFVRLDVPEGITIVSVAPAAGTTSEMKRGSVSGCMFTSWLGNRVS